MGISEIEKRLKEKRAYTLKSIEIRLMQLLTDTKNKHSFREIIETMVNEFGIIILEDDETLNVMEKTLVKLKINPKKFFENIIFKKDIFKKSFLGKTKVDYEKLGLYYYQNAIFLKKEHGGIFTLSELLSMINENTEKTVSVEDVNKAITLLEKKKLIPGRKKIDKECEIIQFIPFELSHDHQLILKIASEKGWTTLEEIASEISWPIERIKVALDKLVELGIAKIDRSYSKGERYYFPAFY
ncbi:MAG: hypothetical protein ACTSQY_04230 [Candidatus Odinarchaeia archaeon]